jgi:hypothetical protein
MNLKAGFRREMPIFVRPTYYDALCSAAMLSGALDLSKRIALDYYTKSEKLAIAMKTILVLKWELSYLPLL